MLNCRDVTKLISESLDRKTTFVEKKSLWFHVMLCGFCGRFDGLGESTDGYYGGAEDGGRELCGGTDHGESDESA